MTDDLISKKALMKEFADFVRRSNNSDFAPTPTWNDAVSLVGSMPSAQPERYMVTMREPTDLGRLKGIIAKSSDITIIPLPKAEPKWIPVMERLPEKAQDVLVTVNDGSIYVETDYFTGAHFLKFWDETVAWMPLPEPWKGEEE